MAKSALALSSLLALSLIEPGCAATRRAAPTASAAPPGPPPMEYAIVDQSDAELLSQLELP